MNSERTTLDAGLWIVGVPIGSARDITLRALDVLKAADVLVAEDTRSLRKLMDIHAIAVAGRPMIALHDHSSERAVTQIADRIASGQSVAYASEAGMPLIADPGYELVRAMHDKGLNVTCAPGPSALTTALAIGGLPTDRVHFAGFLPSAKNARRRMLTSLADVQATLVLFESPKRIAASLADCSDILGPARQARICRELTKKFEEVRAGSLEELHEGVGQNPPKGEIVLLIERATQAQWDDEQLKEALRTALADHSLRDAAAMIAKQSGRPKRAVYQLGLDLED